MDPPDRVPLLLGSVQIIQQDLVDKPDMRVKPGTSWWDIAPVAGWFRVFHDLRDRAAINAIAKCNLPLTDPVLQNINPNPPV
jgi:hypothetical protein